MRPWYTRSISGHLESAQYKFGSDQICLSIVRRSHSCVRWTGQFLEEGMVRFDTAHRAVHYPPDRRFRIWIRPGIVSGLIIAILAVVAAAWIEVAIFGMPQVPAVPQVYPNNFAG